MVTPDNHPLIGGESAMTVADNPTPNADELHSEGYLTVSDAQDQLGVAQTTVSKMIHDGRLQAERRGHRWAMRPEWVAAAASKVGGARIEGYVTAPEAARELDVKLDKVYRAIISGRLPAELIAKPRGYRISRSDLDNWTPPQGTAAEWRQERGLLTAAEAAACVGISRQAMNLRIHSGAQPAERAPEDSPHPGMWVIREQDVPRGGSTKLLTVAEAAAQVERSPDTILRAIRAGRLSATRLPSRRHCHAIAQGDLDKWAEKLRRYPRGANGLISSDGRHTLRPARPMTPAQFKKACAWYGATVDYMSLESEAVEHAARFGLVLAKVAQ